MTQTYAVPPGAAKSKRPLEISYAPLEAFCLAHQCHHDFRGVVVIAAQCFDASSIRLSEQSDLEARESWIEIAVDAAGTVEQLMEAERKFTLRLRAEVSARVVSLVRLYLTAIED